MLKYLIKILFLLEIISSTNSQERQSHIDSIEIMVSDCSHCGMSPLGQIHVKVNSYRYLFSIVIDNYSAVFFSNKIFFFQVCGDGVRGCCVTPNLDHPFQNDWEAGRSYEFHGGDLDECNDFDLGDPANINLEFFMEIYHTGLIYT